MKESGKLSGATGTGLASIRLDKWLWAARFFKTRSLAAEAVEGGKVHLNGQRTKPAHSLKPGDTLRITRGIEAFEVTVSALNSQRRPSSEARTLYVESEESRMSRALDDERRRLLKAAMPAIDRRPNKRERRLIRRFTGRG